MADIVEMTTMGGSLLATSYPNQTNVVTFSPDGKRFAFITKKGDLKTDTVEYRLWIFRTSDVFTFPHPAVVATLSSSSNRPAISQARWLDDSNAMTFIGEQAGGRPQLYRVNVTTKEVTRLTDQGGGVLAYAIGHKSKSMVYLAGMETSARTITPEMFERGFAMTSQRWDDLYNGGVRQGWSDPRAQLWVKTGETAAQRVGGLILTDTESIDTQSMALSPNGRYAVLKAYVLAPSPGWAEYHIKDYAHNEVSEERCTEVEYGGCPQQYFLLDLREKTVEPLVDAPVLSDSEGLELFAWTKENSLLVVNALLPLVSMDGHGREEERRTNVYAAEIAIPGRRITEIAHRKTAWPAFAIYKGTAGDAFVTDPLISAYGKPVQWRRGRSGWEVADVAALPGGPAANLTVTLAQGLNSPPKLVAVDTARKRRAVLLDLNPQFAHLTFGHVEPFKWRTRTGLPMEGALYFPPDYLPGKRYPLVIQTHGYSREQFWPDGAYSTAAAAQPLANRGFLVLQVPTVNAYTDEATIRKAAQLFSTGEEGPYATAVFEGAVDELSHRGLVDTNRVGLTGFSRTVYHVLYALTHSNRHFAAAVTADGVNFGYLNCIYYLVQSDSSLCERMNGGGLPYGPGLAGWAKESPTFRLDRIDAPLLVQAITGPVGAWEILAGLRWLKKPVEMINFFPEGAHILIRPQQRLLSEESVVDWYSFWLKGEEDADPAKADQYARWRKMREERQPIGKHP